MPASFRERKNPKGDLTDVDNEKETKIEKREIKGKETKIETDKIKEVSKFHRALADAT